ncbi:MAG: tetratricopeptide repeat protein [Candidatus Obscuribacterales bacterium]
MAFEHPQHENAFAAAAYCRIAKERMAEHDWEPAEWYLRRALQIAENSFGRFHGEVGMILISLSQLYASTGRHLEQDRIDRRIEEIVDIYQFADAC